MRAHTRKGQKTTVIQANEVKFTAHECGYGLVWKIFHRASRYESNGITPLGLGSVRPQERNNNSNHFNQRNHPQANP